MNLPDLTGRKILLGICGGIAAYKTPDLVRRLKKAGAQVQVVMTHAAREFVTPTTLQAVSGHLVRFDLFDAEHESAMGHIELARWADAILIAPATANFIAEVALGSATDLLSTLIVATDAPIMLVPAMNRLMWSNQATQHNVDVLEQRGFQIWGPASGEQACGETGEGRMLEPEELVAGLYDYFSDGPLKGVKVTITAGPTHEPIDPVRFIGNRSSGKMGFALARAFVLAGATVRLIAGPVDLSTPAGVKRMDVETAQQMFEAVKQEIDACDLFCACAAVADYRVAQSADSKIKKSSATLQLELVPNPDILEWVGKLPNGPFTLGFAAETDNVENYAREKRARKCIDVIAANKVGAEKGGFGADENEIQLIWEQGSQLLSMKNKDELAREIVTIVGDLYQCSENNQAIPPRLAGDS